MATKTRFKTLFFGFLLLFSFILNTVLIGMLFDSPSILDEGGLDNPFYNSQSQDSFSAELIHKTLRSLHQIKPSIPVMNNKKQKSNYDFNITDTELDLWFNNKLFIFESHKMGFCVIEKNSCTMFKQIFKRIKGFDNYLSNDYDEIHYLPFEGLAPESFNSKNKIIKLIKNKSFRFGVFIRDPLERLHSGFVDKCVKKRGINLCAYAQWSPLWKKYKGVWNEDTDQDLVPLFHVWLEGLTHCPCWPEVDKHFAPQYLFCNLYNFKDRFDVYDWENTTERQKWMEDAGIWNQYGKKGWRGGNIVDYQPTSVSKTNFGDDKAVYVAKYSTVPPEILARVINKYSLDYIIFERKMPDWLCNDGMDLDHVDIIEAVRSIPRRLRPSCQKKYPWLEKTP